jgi:hypothetical protein
MEENVHTFKREFTKIIAMSDRIQVHWSHPSSKKFEDLEYILEYGCGMKFNGKEQFRQIYKGKAHKCIVADLNSNTTYRFRVRPLKKEKETSDAPEQVKQTEWSDVVGITTIAAPEKS